MTTASVSLPTLRPIFSRQILRSATLKDSAALFRLLERSQQRLQRLSVGTRQRRHRRIWPAADEIAAIVADGGGVVEIRTKLREQARAVAAEIADVFAKAAAEFTDSDEVGDGAGADPDQMDLTDTHNDGEETHVTAGRP